MSLRDRDDEAINTVGQDLKDLVFPARGDFHTFKWRRRHLESYLLLTEAVARCTGQSADNVRVQLAQHFSLAIGSNFTDSDCPDALMQANGKDVLLQAQEALLANTSQGPVDVALSMRPSEICDDILTFLDVLDDLNPAPPR